MFRNQRNTGKLKVEKRFIGQPVEVSLLIDGKPKAKSADASFDTGFVTVDVGTHGVSEEFTSPAQAALYESSLRLRNAGGVVLKQGDGVQVTGGIEVSQRRLDRLPRSRTRRRASRSPWRRTRTRDRSTSPAER